MKLPRQRRSETGSAATKTIADIARLAGVSVSTVSRVLNNNSEVSKATRKKVLSVIADNDYRPSEAARGLVNQSSRIISVLIPDITNYYYAELISSVETVISQNGYTLFLCLTNGDPAKEEYYLKEMLGHRSIGLLVLSTRISNSQLLEKVRDSMEIVAVEADVPNVDTVRCDNEMGTYDVVSHLISCGHRDIAFLGYQFYLTGLQQRLQGYKRALREHSIPVREELIFEGKSSGNQGYFMTKQLLERKKRPTAIHCMNEYLAAGAYEAIFSSGLSIPEDISVSAFDNLESSRLFRPALTTAGIPINHMGIIATGLLINKIAEKTEAPPQLITFPASLIVRDSTKSI